MSLQYVHSEFIECPSCRAKPGSMCRECLERRELWEVADRLRRSYGLRDYVRELVSLCKSCNGKPQHDCKEHGV